MYRTLIPDYNKGKCQQDSQVIRHMLIEINAQISWLQNCRYYGCHCSTVFYCGNAPPPAVVSGLACDYYRWPDCCATIMTVHSAGVCVANCNCPQCGFAGRKANIIIIKLYIFIIHTIIRQHSIVCCYDRSFSVGALR